MSEEGIDILLVEDCASDAKLTSRWLRESPVVNSIHVAADGEQALRLLRGEIPSARALRPQVVLLDLNLPRTSGFEVLEKLKADPELARIPVIVLSSSDFAEDRRRAGELKASLYLPKPSDADEFAALVSTLEAFWKAYSQSSPRGED